MAYYYLPFSTNFLTSTYTFINLQKIFFTKMLVFGIKIKGRCLNSYCQTKSHFDVLVGVFWEKQCDLVLLLRNIKTWRNCINSDIKYLPDIQHLYITYFIRYHQNFCSLQLFETSFFSILLLYLSYRAFSFTKKIALDHLTLKLWFTFLLSAASDIF